MNETEGWKQFEESLNTKEGQHAIQKNKVPVGYPGIFALV